MKNPWLLVGVDGSDASRLAVRYAATEADRIGADLRIVHVVMDLPPMPGMAPMMDPMWVTTARDVGEGFLQEAVTAASELLDGDRIGTSLLTGERVSAIVNAAEGAAGIVLGDERRSLLDRLVVGSVIAGVASRSTVPVFAVPDRWDPAELHHTVVVGAKSLDKSVHIIHAAAAIAEQRRGKLVILHSWSLPAAYDDLAISALDQKEFTDRAMVSLRPALDEIAAAFPTVTVELKVVNGHAATVLVEASKEADVVVLARRNRQFPVGYLGSTGRAVLRESMSPVAVVPPPITE